MSATAETPRATAWSPLGVPAFRALWLATLASSIGTWMHEIGAGWLMTSLSPTPVMVAMVQTATMLPAFILALPAGALADIVDRRSYLLVIQVWLGTVALVLGLLTFAGWMTAWTLVALTFAMGIGAAMMMPAWAALTPALVPRHELQGAVALNSMGFNVARAIGPALAGLIVASAGPGAVFLLNAASYVAVIIVLYRWRGRRASQLPAERLLSALRVGFRFARHHQPLHAALLRGLAFFVFASASWALLPLIARERIGGGPGTYGLLVAAVGLGAVLGAFLLPRLRERFDADAMVAGATGVYALSLAVLGVLTNVWALCVAMMLSGVAWIAVLSTLQVAAQMALPDWVRARGLAVFMANFMGSMALGSLLWGYVAQTTSITTSLLVAAGGAVVAVALSWRWRIGGLERVDLTPSMHWPCPDTHEGVTHDRGPVIVTIRYVVPPENQAQFLANVRRLGQNRRRDGAFAWGIMEDAEQAGEFIEYFMTESWLEHLRQHERVTHEDRRIEDLVRSLIEPGSKPVVRHLVAAEG